MICDTDTVFLDKLASAIHKNYDPCSVEYVYGPRALEVSLKSDPGGADVLLTEVELRSENAISIIERYLKESSPLQIIYMTSKIEYCTEVYNTPHCGFLLKPVNIQKMIRDINRALAELEKKKARGIVVRKNRGFHIIAPDSIMYIESNARVLKIVTEKDTLETYDKLTNFSERLDRRFIQCHKSYVVNIEQIKKYRGDSFLMKDGYEIPISQSKRKEVKDRFLAYVGNALTVE